MPTPKSQVKIKVQKGGDVIVSYESNLDATQYFMYELCRAALRDVGKFIVKTWRTAYYTKFTKHTGDAGKATYYKVYSGKSTTNPRLEIGLPHSYKGRTVDGFYAYFQELGASNVPRLGLLTRTAQDNVAEIVKIQSQYLDGLNDEASRLEALVNEEDYDGDADGDE